MYKKYSVVRTGLTAEHWRSGITKMEERLNFTKEKLIDGRSHASSAFGTLTRERSADIKTPHSGGASNLFKG